MHLMAASELPAAAGGLLAGDPLLRAHVSRLPDAQVMELLNSGAAAYREVALAVLVERGASEQASLLASFPRPLSGPRRELVASGQALEEHGPVIWLLTQQLRDVVDSLREFLTHPDADHRYYATVLLLRANDQASLGRVAELLYDPDEQVRSAAMRYVETWRQNSAVESVLAVVRRHFSDGDPRNVAISVVAAAELRDVAAIPTLIEFLDHASDHVRRRAQTSLVRLTFQELGNDRRTWDKWYKKFSGAGRDRWLLEAMVDRDIRVRENAAREIRSIPRLVVNYNPEFDLRGQQTAQRTVEHFLSLRRGHF
jgi:HEAT repeat protein